MTDLADDLADKTVVLTGASGGIGLALTDYLLSRGMRRLACQYRAPSGELFELLRRHDLDPEAHCHQADLSDEDQVRGLADAVLEELGNVWGLVNLAGASSNGVSWQLSLEDFRRIQDDNLTTTFLTCREFIPGMREARGGRIVNISSVVAFSGVAGASHYCAAKAGVVGFTKSIARELVSRGITVNAVALGYFDYGILYTVPENLREDIRQQVPARRFGRAAEVGAMLMYLLGADAAYTTGQVLHVNGGLYG